MENASAEAARSCVLSQRSLHEHVIVDPDTLKIKAIIDWEYVGFYPPEFESPFYQRLGPSIALDGEVDDFDLLTRIISDDGK